MQPSLKKKFECGVCGKVVDMIHESATGDIICCGNPMSATGSIPPGTAVVRPNLDEKQHIAATIVFFALFVFGLIFAGYSIYSEISHSGPSSVTLGSTFASRLLAVDIEMEGEELPGLGDQLLAILNAKTERLGVGCLHFAADKFKRKCVGMRFCNYRWR